MISEQYINEGIRIRKKYIQNLKEILKQEPIISEKKKRFEQIQNEMSQIVSSDMNDMRKTLDLNNRLILLEKEIKKIQDIIKPYYETIENLKNDRDRLYLSIN
jgi:prefoldin subunit 5